MPAAAGADDGAAAVRAGGGALAAGWLLAACDGSSGIGAVDHPLQRPARADHRLAGERLREGDRHHRQRPQRRRGHPGRPDRRRGVPLAGRRHLHRELAGARVPPGQGPAGPGRPVHAGPHPEPVQLAPGRLGRRLGPGQRAHLQPDASSRRASCRPRCCSSPIRGTRASWPSPPGRPTSSRSSPRWRAPTATPPRSTGSRGSRPTPAATSTPTTRPSPTRSTGARSPSGSSTSTTGTGCAPRSARPTCTRRSPTSPRATPATSSTSPAPACSESSTHQAAAQRFLAFLVSKQGQEIIAHSISFEYPIASGVTTASPRPRSTAPAEPDHHRRAGRRLDGHLAAAAGGAAVTGAPRADRGRAPERPRPRRASTDGAPHRRRARRAGRPWAARDERRRGRGAARPARLPAHRGRRGRGRHRRPSHLAPADRHPAVEHRPADRGGHRPLRGHRHARRPGASNAPTFPVARSGRCSWSFPSPSPTSWSASAGRRSAPGCRASGGRCWS